MSNGQKILFGGSILSYLFVLYSFFHFDLRLVLVFFVIHSLMLLTLAFLFWKDQPKDKEELADSLHEKLEEQTSISELKNAELADANLRLASANLRIRTLEDEIALLRDNAAARTGEAKESEAVPKAGEKGNCEALLPPVGPLEDPDETFNILSIAQDTIRELSPFADRANIKILLSAPENSLFVKGSRDRLRILFRNIIDNSIKYMSRSGTLLITISTIGDEIFIVCKDNGNGLSERETEHVFELNYQGSNRVSGTGLGLAQAKAIVDYYGGTIYAKSTIGRGMGIYIQLPTT